MPIGSKTDILGIDIFSNNATECQSLYMVQPIYHRESNEVLCPSSAFLQSKVLIFVSAIIREYISK